MCINPLVLLRIVIFRENGKKFYCISFGCLWLYISYWNEYMHLLTSVSLVGIEQCSCCPESYCSAAKMAMLYLMKVWINGKISC